MNPEHDTEALEALARGEHVTHRADLDAHLASCDDCAHELAWLRAEQRLICERDHDAPPVDRLWRGVAARLPSATASSLSPYRTASPPPSVPERRPWRAFAAGFAAAALLGVGVAALTLKVNSHQAPSHGPGRNARRSAHAHSEARVEGVLPVSGPVLLHLETWSADVKVFAATTNEIRAIVRGVEVDPHITQRPDGRYDLVFNGRRLTSGEVDVLVPRGSSVEATTASGDVTVGGGLGDVRIATTSGDIRATGVRDAEITTSSGDLAMVSTGARVRVRTVSGNARIVQSATAQVVDLETTSGDVDWSGNCARDCRMGARSVSGNVGLTLTRESGFTLRFTTVSGELSDELGTGAVLPEGGGPAAGRHGSGEGVIEVTTNSGSLTLTQPAADGGR